MRVYKMRITTELTELNCALLGSVQDVNRVTQFESPVHEP